MESSNLSLSTLLLILIVTISIPKLVAAQLTFAYKLCGNATYTPNSTYQSNLKSVLNNLSTDTRITHGYYNFSVGHDPDRVSAFILCRGDVPVNTCRACVQNSASMITTPDNCPNQKQAFGYTGYCSIYYSNGSITGKVQDVPPWHQINTAAISNAGSFNISLYSLIDMLQNKAAAGDSTLKYATGQANFSGGQTVYGLVQCTPDLSKQACIDCLRGSFSILPQCCVKPKYKAYGLKLAQPSCFVQYSFDSFFGNVPDTPVLPPPPSFFFG